MATNYFWDEIEDNVVEEYDDDGNTIAHYTTEPTLYGSVLSQKRNSETRYFQFDGQGNTNELTDESGNVTDTNRYSAFGLLFLSAGITQLAMRFGGCFGYMADNNREQYHVRRRAYSTNEGRWLSPDPAIRLRELANRYAFVDNAPQVNHDPSGLQHLHVSNVRTFTETCKMDAAPPPFYICRVDDVKGIENAPPCSPAPCPSGYQCHHDPGFPPKPPFKRNRTPKTYCVKCGCIEDPLAAASDECCFGPFATAECTSTSGVGPLNRFVVKCACHELA